MAFRILLPLILILIFFLYVALYNVGAVRFFFAQGRSMELPLVVVVMVSFLAGALSLSLVQFFKAVGEVVNDLSNLFRRSRAARLESSFIKARGLAANGDPDRAVQRLDAILHKKPGHFDALMLKGSLLRKTGRFEEALRSHSLALSERPADAGAIREIAEDYREAGDVGSACGMLKRLIAVGAHGLDLISEIRDLNIQAGRFARAESAQREALSLITDEDGRRAGHAKLAEVLCLAGEQLSAEGKNAEALARFVEAVNAAPDFVPAKIMMGDALAALGRSAEAEEHFKEMFFKTGSLLPLLRMVKHGLGGEGFYDWVVESANSARADAAAAGKIAYAARSGGDLGVDYRCAACNAVEADYFAQCLSCGAWSSCYAVVKS
ncbi:MAG: tetratricopeptide repeat protein [Nitrospinae bacterium]|nr:tetratricopeptide repeat protein [Nitrospinota bacterium]